MNPADEKRLAEVRERLIEKDYRRTEETVIEYFGGVENIPRELKEQSLATKLHFISSKAGEAKGRAEAAKEIFAELDKCGSKGEYQAIKSRYLEGKS